MASPGVQYLLQLLLKLLLPALLVHYLSWYVQDLLPLLRSSAVRAVIYLSAGPLYLYSRVLWRSALAVRRARKLGATFFPVYRTRWPLGLDVIVDIVRTIDSEYIADKFLALTEEYGPTFIMRFMGEEVIFTTEPQRFGDATNSVLGTGVFNADECREFDILAGHADKVIQKMKDSFNSGTPVDMQDAMARFTIDSATEFLFGSCVNSILEPFAKPGESLPSMESSDSHPTVTAFVQAFTKAQFLINRRTRLGHSWKLWEMRRDESLKFVADMDRFLGPITEAALARGRELGGPKVPGEIEDEMTFLDHMVTQTQDAKIIRDSLMNMLIAGRDTTACTLTYIVYLLSQHPAVFVRLRDDILRVVGPVEYPTYDDIRNIQYLRAVINETLRLFPPVPLNMRDSIEEDIWTGEDGQRYYVGPNMSIPYSPMLMQRSRAYWGEDALEFDPDRWIDDRLRKFTENPFSFLPFNAGPRICLGQQFAYNELSFMIIRLLQSFSSVELRPDAQPKGSIPRSDWPPRGRNLVEKIWPRAHLTLYVMGGLWLTMGEASVTGDA
ncbi:hypothetical protein BS47DRAFT_1370206 [Hydnum rufescens UP504]|uniref:Cytochrome P450 n=1 Tax=Hydnum rufescens UP504 TaxID=1448309 RepID=A0A9P6BB03_9AGAM|nr:hypothetical protein BS47DRAFT_1370206 [Hydnum rufescens UP504]